MSSNSRALLHKSHAPVVWIIGASSGIGHALAKAWLGRGAHVVVSARNADALQQLRQQHGEDAVTVIALDVTREIDLYWAVDTLNRDNKLPQSIVYCAGYYIPMSAADFNLTTALKHDDVNYRGALHLLAAALPPLLQRGSGHIALVSSVAGYRGLPRALAYGPTKAALINLAETLRLELMPHNIKVQLINPGFVETPLTAQNKFSMPALISPAVAADEIIKGMASERFEIHFPKRFTLWLKLLRLMPYPLYFALVKRFTGL